MVGIGFHPSAPDKPLNRHLVIVRLAVLNAATAQPDAGCGFVDLEAIGLANRKSRQAFKFFKAELFHNIRKTMPRGVVTAGQEYPIVPHGTVKLVR